MELAVPRFVPDARKNGLSSTDCFGPLDAWIPANPASGPATPGLYPEAIASGIRELYRRNILRLCLKELRRFYVVEVFRPPPPITGSQRAGKRFRSLAGRAPSLGNVTHDESTGWSSKGPALQFACGLDFLSLQADRRWMEYPSR